MTTTLATGARLSLTSTGSAQYAGKSDQRSATLDLCIDASAGVLPGSADAASHRRARGRTRPWKEESRALLRSASGEHCRRGGRSQARSSRTPPAGAASPDAPSPERSTRDRKSSTPVPPMTVDVAYSTDDLAGPSLRVSSRSRRREDTRVLTQDSTASSSPASREDAAEPPEAPAPLISSSAPASSVTSLAYPPGRTVPHTPL